MRKNKLHAQEIVTHLGEAIRNRRIDMLISQDQLGVKAGFHRSYITDLENGRRNLSFITLSKIALALNLRISHLIAEQEKIADGPVL